VLAQVPELNVIEVALDPVPTGRRPAAEIEMFQHIQQHKSLMIDGYFPSLAERDRVVSHLEPRGLCVNARFAPDEYRSLPAGLPGSEVWILA